MNGRERRRQKASEQILEAAAEAIAEHGFHGMTMRGLASATGIALANFYNYFESKEALLFELNTRAFSALSTTMEAELRKSNDPAEQLYLFIANHVEYFVQHTAVMRVLVHEAARLEAADKSAVRLIKDEYFNRLRTIVEQIVQPGGVVDPRQIDRMTYCMFGMMNWVYAWYEPKLHGSSADVARTIHDLAMSGMFASVSQKAREISEELLDSSVLPSPLRRKEGPGT